MIKLRRLLQKDCDGMLEWMHDTYIQQSFQKAMLSKTREDVLNFIKMQNWK